MGLLNFNRNKSGNTYDGKESSRKGFIDRIKWEMSNDDDLVYKFPHDNITTGATLIVNESHRAFLYKGGAFYDSFGPGTHQLTTENIPFLQSILNIPTGGDTNFTAEVWYVNTELVKLNMNWGAGGLRIIDPYYDIPVKMGAFGQYGFKISDPEIFLKRMVATLHSVTTDKIYEQFRSDVVQGISVQLGKFMKEKGVSVNDLIGDYHNISQYTKQSLDETFSTYGIELLKFVIEEINVDETDEAYKKAVEGIGLGAKEKQRIDRLGDKYAQARQFDVMEKAAENESAGGMMGGMMGAGMGAGMGMGMGNMMSNGMQQQQQQQQQQAPQAAAPPPPPQGAQFHITQNGQTSGPYSMQQMQEYAQQNILQKDTLVWKNGMSGWANADTVPELQSLFQAAPPPPPPPPPM